MYIEKDKYMYIEYLKNKGVIALFTKKNAGNMSKFVDINICSNETGLSTDKNIENILNLENISNKKNIFGKQTHSSNILIIDNDFDENINIVNIDGYITKRKDINLICFFADCMPIYFYDNKNKVIALCHSGWQGTYNEILKVVLEKMKINFNSKIDDIMVFFGVNILQKDYEVGKDFYNKFIEKFSENDLKDVFKKNNDKYFYDNMKLNENLCLKYGIINNNIFKSNFNVIDNNCHSYRRDKEFSGRSMAVISLM